MNSTSFLVRCNLSQAVIDVLLMQKVHHLDVGRINVRLCRVDIFLFWDKYFVMLRFDITLEIIDKLVLR